MIMNTEGPGTRVPGYPGTRSTWVPGYPGTRYPFSNVSPWSACLTIPGPPDTLFKNGANDPVQQAQRSTLELKFFFAYNTYIIGSEIDSGLQRDSVASLLTVDPRRGRILRY